MSRKSVSVPRVLLAPPPKRRIGLGQGAPTAPDLSPEQIKTIETRAQGVIEDLQSELETAKVEADLVSDKTLRSVPDAYKEIPEIGQYFTPQEVRSQIVLDATAIQDEATRVMTGAIGKYISDKQAQDLNTIVSDAKALVSYIQQFDLTPIKGAKSKISEDHLSTHMNAIENEVAVVERGVVSGEASSVPVVENPGQTSVLGSFLALGILVGVTVLIVDLA